MDALYFRVSSERQTTQNQIADLFQVAENDGSGRNWNRIKETTSKCVIEEERKSAPDARARTTYRLDPQLAAELARECVYVEQGRSGKIGAGRRPMFEQLKRDAAGGKFSRLLVWKVSRLGRDMREVIATVYELADLGITVIPVKSATGPITSTMGKLLWAIQAWYAEMENSERSDAIKAGQARARAQGKHMGRPAKIVPRDSIRELRNSGHSWPQIAAKLEISARTARRIYDALPERSRAGQNSAA
jgi:putative DNA-invertase from lambdoid prophage Rac